MKRLCKTSIGALFFVFAGALTPAEGALYLVSGTYEMAWPEPPAVGDQGISLFAGTWSFVVDDELFVGEFGELTLELASFTTNLEMLGSTLVSEMEIKAVVYYENGMITTIILGGVTEGDDYPVQTVTSVDDDFSLNYFSDVLQSVVISDGSLSGMQTGDGVGEYTITPIPEPTAAVLLLSGLGVSIMRRRR
jgi:hypothetical protein